MLQFVETWKHAGCFTPRELEYLALEVVHMGEVFPLSEQEAEQIVHEQLDDAWDTLADAGWNESQIVLGMTHKSGSPVIEAMLRNE